ncbi:lasso RiPP family leader peptide-containing protein [Nocardiopsis sp. RSe5-2]|uniref:Lasso RiPP family leader peptide-containing protein n=1 Tax=Nocardiopsis endophytica TaxID=3018445 RepID=A0ABT4TXC2_9ACTN|nr:lasso RiPP family leader peptide-containing protein [Nocardiopsis endophytica]MDA2809076.1 lasso RiPP family leader peptide-containing protein [Nocardiopsis endophytica]
MREYTAPALTDLGTFGELTLSFGPLPVFDGFTLGLLP